MWLRGAIDGSQIYNVSYVPQARFGIAFCEASGPCLNAIKHCQEVSTIHCATANPVEVVVVETGKGEEPPS